MALASIGRRFVLTAALVAAVTVAGATQTNPVALRFDEPRDVVSCGTRSETDLSGIRSRAVGPIPDGETLSFEQDPPLIYPNYAGPITLRRFMVVGDLPTLQFYRWNPDNADGDLQVWQRATTTSIGGRLISIFEPTWDAGSVLDRDLGRVRVGYDKPSLFLGAIVVAGARRSVNIRLGFNGIPHSDVVAIDATAQYASNVINLVMPGFGDSRTVAGSQGFELSAATQQALRYITDTYDDIAFVPLATPVEDYGAYHVNVRNSVTGINIPTFDSSAAYGSKQRLQGVELDTPVSGARYEDTNHEMGHQWNSNFDWSRIAGITRAGHQPSSHSPLWSGGESLLGAVLFANRRVRSLSAGFAIEATPAPVHFHPLELYAMGLQPPEQVADFQVFVDQGQFDIATAAVPVVDAPVTGDAKVVSIRDVIREHGARSGPTPSSWRRATVLVSTDHLASQAEMDYWNFFAQRLADRSGAGTPTYEGYVPFRVATGNTVPLSTSIAPIGRPAIAENLETDRPSFGATDWRGLEFTQPLPSRLAPGDVLRLAGRVTASDRSDFSQISVIFYRVDSPDPVRFSGAVSRSGDFTVDIRFTDSQRGRYSMGAYLFWPGASPQYARTSLSTLVVQ